MAYITKKTTVNGVKPIGSNLFGTCSTASGTAQKDVTMADFDVLVSGVTIHVYFANKNTASNPTLKVGSTSAVAIMCNGASEGNWEDGAVISFTCNGSNWIQNDASEGGGATYTLSKSGDTITLTGSDGSTSSVTDSDTILKYTADAPDGATTNNVVQNDVTNNVASGGYSLAEGIGTTASGLYSHAEGQGTTASGDRSHAEGNGSTASGHSSRAEGNGTVASGNHSHAEGNASVASGSGSHAEGGHTEASGDAAHAEGYYSVASGNRSFAGNNRTIAQRADQTAIGRMNIADTQGADGGELGKYAFIIGNGNADDDRSNAFTVDWQGRVECGDYSGAFKSLFDIFYPVGSYYETSDTTFNPNTAWGGTWILETEGVVHVSAGTSYAVTHANDNGGVGAKDGGAATVTLTSAQSAMPSHHHGLNNHVHSLANHAHSVGRALGVSAGSWAGDSASALSGSGHKYAYVGDSTTNAVQTITATGGNNGNTGGNSGNTTDSSVATASQAHENMPPYINVNRWHRTA